MLKRIKEDTMLFSVGGLAYGAVELLWRHRTHWTMIVTGGVCLLVLFRVFKKISKIKTIYKCAVGSVLITAVEFVVGCIVNLQFKMNVWDYSAVPFNIWGQICPLYSILWFFLTIPILFVCKKMQNVIKWL
ncbi:putative ABC transporter permease [Oscillospiraceae bacterium LCP25S3_E10]